MTNAPSSRPAPAVRREVKQPAAPDTAKERRVEYELITCPQLDAARYSLEYLVDAVLVARQPCIFAGGKKTLKTSLLIAMGLSLATGKPFLGQFAVRRAARVLMMTGESGMATIQETARRIAGAMELRLADVSNLIFSANLPVFGNALHMEALRATLVANEIEVLIVDPAYLAMPTDGGEGSLFAMGVLLRSVSEACQECGVTFILAHHTRKTLTDPFAPPELDDIAWAGFNEFARQWVLISRRERYEPGSGQHRLWLNAGGSAGHSSCSALDVAEGVYDGRTPRHWQLSVTGADVARQHAEQRKQSAKEEKRKTSTAALVDADCKAVVSAMSRMEDGTGTKTQIKDRAHLSTSRLNAALDALYRAGQIIECETTKGNARKYPAWKLWRE